jgi:hypothetical protein
MRRFRQLIDKGLCKPCPDQNEYALQGCCRGSCHIHINGERVYTGRMKAKCCVNIINWTTPVLLDCILATKRFYHEEYRYCPMCLYQLRHEGAAYHKHPFVCEECRPVFDTEYRSVLHHVWLCGHLLCPDVARVIGLLMVSFFLQSTKNESRADLRSMRRFGQLVDKGICVQTSSPGEYSIKCAQVANHLRPCVLYIEKDRACTTDVRIDCCAYLIRCTTPVFLDSVEANIEHRDYRYDYCPQCWKQLTIRHKPYHWQARLCLDCRPVFAAQYNDMVRRWLLARTLLCEDVARMIMRLIVAV